ncbi:hypothetical protein ACFE04_003713 [Oxalis oulophora]
MAKDIGPEFESQSAIWGYMLAFADSMALKCAIELGLADIIHAHNAPMSLSQIAATIIDHSPSSTPNMDNLNRVIRYLVNMKIFTSTVDTGGETLYGPTPLSKWISNDFELGIAPLVLFNNFAFHQAGLHFLAESVKNGGDAYTMANGCDTWAFASKNAHYNELLNKSMSCMQSVAMAIIDQYEGLKTVGSLVNVGGGTGQFLAGIIEKHPHIKGINFDLPHVIAMAPELPGVVHVSGDMFDSIPSGEIIMLKAIPKNGKVVIIDIVLKPNVDGLYCPNGLKMDMLMLGCTGGKERTEHEIHKSQHWIGHLFYKFNPGSRNQNQQQSHQISYSAYADDLSDNEVDFLEENPTVVDGNLADMEALYYDNGLESRLCVKAAKNIQICQHNAKIGRCSALLIDIGNEIIIVDNFVHDRHRLKFSELDSHVCHPIDYTRIVKKIGNEMDLCRVDLEGHVSKASITVVTLMGETEDILYLDDANRKIIDFVVSRIGFIAPNLSAVVGSRVAAKLMGTAGGLSASAKMPACNVQLLGAEKKNKNLAGGDASGNGRRAFLEEIHTKIDKRQEAPPPPRQSKALPVPDFESKKKRGGHRLRKMKEWCGMTQMRKKLAAEEVSKKFKVGNVSGPTSNYAFTPVQGIEVLNPTHQLGSGNQSHLFL